MATGTKVAGQASSLADELLAAAAANRSNLTTLVRAEVDAAISRLGLVPVQRLEEAQAEAARLRAEVARLSSATPKAAPTSTPRKATSKSTPRKATSQSTPRKAAAAKSTQKAASPRTAKKAATSGRSAVTTRVKPAGT
jgi:hypothetical protein